MINAIKAIHFLFHKINSFSKTDFLCKQRWGNAPTTFWIDKTNIVSIDCLFQMQYHKRASQNRVNLATFLAIRTLTNNTNSILYYCWRIQNTGFKKIDTKEYWLSWLKHYTMDEFKNNQHFSNRLLDWTCPN